MVQNYGGGVIAAIREGLRPDLTLEDMKLMLANPMAPWRETLAKQPPPATPITPLGIQAGMLDIVPGHRAWQQNLGGVLPPVQSGIAPAASYHAMLDPAAQDEQ